jgi:NAD(P)-dependent dehydrogenase (short-subunit alcohol dehydrogenase family)
LLLREKQVQADLHDKVAIVTGANSGIGLACAKALRAAGAHVVAADREITNLGDMAAIEMDLLEADASGMLVKAAVQKFGGLDILVNNLGGAKHRGSLLEVTDQDWNATLDLNFFSGLRMCRAALPALIERGSSAIVSIASDAGRQPDPFYVDYCVAKAAVISLIKSISIEFGPKGVRANAVAPGPTLTPGLIDFFETSVAPKWQMSTDEAIDHFARNIRKLPLGRLGKPEDVANIVVFLSSDLAQQITGSTFGVDGGVMHVM